MAQVALHRTQERRNFPVPVRVQLLEEDADTTEAEHVEIAKRMDTMNARLFGILLALVAGLLALTANLVVIAVK